jgi:hypothetical protein
LYARNKEATRAHTLTIGKLRGLCQIANDGGIFTMAAEDQRGSMRRMPCAPCACYHQDRDLFSQRESARLAFLRWLYRTGQVVP